MIKKIISHPLFSGSAIMVGGGMFVNAVNYLYHVVMGRLLGPSDYGLLASIFALLYIISIVPLSSSVAIVKFVSAAKDKNELSGVYLKIKSYVWKIAVVSSLGVLLLSPFLKWFLHIDSIFLIFMISPILFLSLVTLVNQSTSQGLLKFTGLVIPNLISSITKLVLGLALVIASFSVAGALAGVIVGVLFAYFYSVGVIKKEINFEAKQDFEISKFIKYALPALMQALAFAAYFTIDILLVRHYLPEYEAGLYASLSTLGKIIYFAASPVSATMFPIVSGRVSRGEEYKTVFLLSLVVTVGIAVVITLFYYLFPNIAIGVLYGPKYLMAAKELVWMGVFMIFYTVSFHLMNFFLSLGKTKLAYFALLVLVMQTVLIVFNHSTILVVIQMNLLSMIILFLGLSLFLAYNQGKLHGETK
ncbi:MAG: oligosaccharide flippase family protein [Patescibacteria group bacterium]